MADWGMAAVIVAMVAFFFADPLLRSISSLFSNIRRWIWTSGTCCEQLSWNDISDGKVHQCMIFCNHWDVHHGRTSCWETTIGQVFNHTWKSPSRRVLYTRKPERLTFSNRFLCTDIDTILAFIFCTAQPDGGSKSHYVPHIETHDHCGILVVHLTGNLSSDCVDLTKHEIHMMLRGYPPYYRENVILKHGPFLPHPIRDARDITRGGWIIAAGLSNITPSKLYTLEDDLDLPFQKALQRVLSILEVVLLTKFPTDENLRNVIRAVEYMVRSGTGSGVGNYGVSQHGVPGGELEQLNGQQCHLAMTIFNDFEPLTIDQETQLKPILAAVLNAAFLGTYYVVQYVKDTGRHLFVPKILLEHRHKHIYLTDCAGITEYR